MSLSLRYPRLGRRRRSSSRSRSSSGGRLFSGRAGPTRSTPTPGGRRRLTEARRGGRDAESSNQWRLEGERERERSRRQRHRERGGEGGEWKHGRGSARPTNKTLCKITKSKRRTLLVVAPPGGRVHPRKDGGVRSALLRGGLGICALLLCASIRAASPVRPAQNMPRERMYTNRSGLIPGPGGDLPEPGEGATGVTLTSPGLA